MSALGKIVKVAFIDLFGKNKSIAMGQAARKDFTHGELTCGVLKTLTKKLKPQIDIFPVKPRIEYKSVENSKNSKIIRKKSKDKMSFDPKSLLKHLKKISVSKEQYDYVNISTSFRRTYELVEGATPHNLSDPKIRQAFIDQLPLQIKHIIDEIEKLTSSGTKVYISACNKPKEFNVLSLAKGVKTIGGKDAITNQPIKRFSINDLVSEYQPLPVYITGSEQVAKNAKFKAVKMSDIVHPDGDMAKLSYFELRKKVATKKDYEKLKDVVERLYAQKKFIFDLDFMRFKFPASVGESLQGKIFEIDKIKEIFKGKFSQEIMDNTFPMGTHCDVSFRQFFDMKSRSKCIMPITRTTKIPNTVSGTSFAAPQALAEDIIKTFGQNVNLRG